MDGVLIDGLGVFDGIFGTGWRWAYTDRQKHRQKKLAIAAERYSVGEELQMTYSYIEMQGAMSMLSSDCERRALQVESDSLYQIRCYSFTGY
jgi:hypothetical protein